MSYKKAVNTTDAQRGNVEKPSDRFILTRLRSTTAKKVGAFAWPDRTAQAEGVSSTTSEWARGIQRLQAHDKRPTNTSSGAKACIKNIHVHKGPKPSSARNLMRSTSPMSMTSRRSFQDLNCHHRRAVRPPRLDDFCWHRYPQETTVYM